jgi:ABC-2 type transport system permease protein
VRRILFLARAEVLHIVRDRATLAQVLVLPILQLFVLSNAATFEIRNTPMYVVDFDRTSASRQLVARFDASGHFRIVGQSASRRGGRRAAAGDVTLFDMPVSGVGGPAEERAVQLAVNAKKARPRGSSSRTRCRS